jgi:hypothetical protein
MGDREHDHEHSSGLKRIAARAARLPGVLPARRVTELLLAPNVRSLRHRTADLEGRLDRLEDTVHRLHLAIEALESHQPAVLNAIASTNGAARRFAREAEELRGTIAEGDAATLDAVRPHVETVAWLVQRIETVRAEMLHELRYGPAPAPAGEPPGAPVEARVLHPEKLEVDDLRLNVGAGHVAMEGFVNVDVRELPGIDVVASADSLPFEPGTVAEIFSSHALEHFPEEQLRRTLLPYWIALLRPGGTLRAVVPDLEAMAAGYRDGAIPFETYRSVTYGGQEYAGDFHLNGFTPDSLAALLAQAGLVDVRVLARGRPNGDCLELEVSAARPRG